MKSVKVSVMQINRGLALLTVTEETMPLHIVQAEYSIIYSAMACNILVG